MKPSSTPIVGIEALLRLAALVQQFRTEQSSHKKEQEPCQIPLFLAASSPPAQLLDSPACIQPPTPDLSIDSDADGATVSRVPVGGAS